MFDVVFGIFSAWNFIGLFLMGSVFMLIGGAIVGYEVYWRVKAMRVRGVVSGVRVVGRRKEEEPELNVLDASQLREAEQEKVVRKKEKKSSSIGNLVGLLFFIVPLIFICVGVFFGYKYYDLTNNGQRVDALVVDVKSSTDSEGSTTYSSVVRFTDANDRVWTLKDGVGRGGGAAFGEGERVVVYYDPSDPERFVIYGFWHNMILPIAFTGMGSLFIGIFGAAIFYGGKGNGSRQRSKSRKPSSSSMYKYANEVYYPVFEYALRNGERVEKVGEVGRGALTGMEPGTRVTLLVMEGSEKVRRPSILLPLFGLIFFAPGAFVMSQALRNFEFNIMIPVLLIAIFIFIGLKIKRAAKKIPWDEMRKEWKNIKSDGLKITTSNKGLKGVLLNSDEIKERLRLYAKQLRISGYLMTVIALGLFVGSYYAGLDMIDKVSHWERARGEVVDFNSRRSSSGDGGYQYYSVISFYDDNGRKVRFEDSIGSSHRMHKRGDEVSVLYHPERHKKAIIDRGLWNWGLSGSFVVLAILSLWAAFRSFIGARKHGGTRYRSRM